MSNVKTAFYVCVGLSLAFSFLGFFALADLIQYAISFPREFTFAVFGWRIPLMVLGVATFLATFYLGWKHKLAHKLALLVYGGLFWGPFVGGFINPTYIMFVSQHYGAKYVSPDQVAHLLPDDEEVMVVVNNDQARAYPNLWMTRPHIAGDVIGGDDIVMTYCGLSHLGVAYRNEVDGKKMDLKVMTQLENNLVMFDAETGEPIQQIHGRFEGSGQQMYAVPSTVMPFGSFRKLYPEGKVFFNPPTGDLIDTITLKVMLPALYGEGAQYDLNTPEPEFPTIEYSDTRVPSKEQVFGVNLNGESVAYTLGYLKKNNNVVVETVGGAEITVKYFPDYGFVDVFYGAAEDVDPHGMTPEGKTLARVPHASRVLWIIWSHFFQPTGARV